LFRLNQAERHIEKHGLLIKGVKGNQVKNPAAQLARSYRISVQRWFTNFGLTPADRSRIPGSTAAKMISPLETAREQLKQPSTASVQ
jgi:P27 family predicted phage terminase small subunit